MLEPCDFQFLLGQQYDHSKRICGSYLQVYTVILVIVLTQQTTTTGKSAHDTSHLWYTTWPLFTHCTCKCTSSNMLTEIAVANNSSNVIDLHLRIKMRSRAVLWGCYATRGLPILLSSGSLSVTLTTTILWINRARGAAPAVPAMAWPLFAQIL